jgi:tetratricopeptide (TPR) repeat protein
VSLVAAAIAAIGLGVAGGAAPKLKEGASLEDVYHANNRGAALMEQYRSAQAMEEFAKVTDLAPAWAPGQVNLGFAALYARQMDTAEKAFLEAVRLDPLRVQGSYGLALLYKGQGKGSEAIAAFEKARALDPEDPDILYNLGVLFGRERRFPEAIAALERARQIDPNNMSVRYQLARALLQSGDKTRGESEMAAYQKLAANPKFAQPTGNQYGEAGRDAFVVVDYRDFGGPPAPAEPLVVRFSDATATSGVTFKHGGPGGAGSAGGAAIAARGSGVGVGDLDGDGRADLVFANADAAGKAGPAVYLNRGDFVFEEKTAASKLAYAGAGLGVALGDYDNDGDLDVALTGGAGLALFRNDGAALFNDVTAAARATVAGVATGAAWGDIDHDGDLDLYVPRLPQAAGKPAGAALLLNRGDGTFAESAAALKLLGPAGGAVGALFSDLDLDRDIDVVVSAAGGPDALLDNRRDQGFADAGRVAGFAAKGAGRGVASGDVDGDGRPDLVFASGAAGGNVLLINGVRRPMTKRALPSPRGGVTYGVTLFDADNDGDLDLFAVGSGLLYLKNDGRGQFTDATAEAGLDSLSFKEGRAVGAADFDGDGDLDLVVTTNGGGALLLRNEGGHRNRSIEVAPKGLNSNRQGVGAKVEVQSGPVWQRREIQAGSGYLSSAAVPAHFGLGGRALVDVVRLLWPGGVIQAELDVPAGAPIAPQELDRKGSSCPLLFSWDGAKYVFVADALGVGGLGLWLAPGKYGMPVPDEYVKVEAPQLQPLDGAYLFQVLENLEEITYLDAARLMAVDHPKNLEVWPNEDFAGPKTTGHRMLAIEKSGKIFPTRAVDQKDKDVTDKVLKIDRTYPDEFRLHSLAGYAEMHHLTLEFPPEVVGREGLYLFLYGWTDFEYASSNFAAYQSGLTQTLPVLETEDADGLYQPVIDSIGFPPGLPRMIAVDLASLGKLASRRMRIRTNMRVYWDQIFLARPLDEAAFADQVTVSEAGPVGAHLHKRGYPREHSPDGRQPRIYDYSIMDATQPFKAMSGDYTRFGRVTDLLRDADDRSVIFGRGEEITLEFGAKDLATLKKGRVRNFVLHLSGWCKDMDPHTAFGDTVEPLPFRSMSGYPYAEGESYPDTPLLKEYRSTWNTRQVEGR